MKLIRTDIGNYYCPEDPGEVRHSHRPQRLSVTDEEGLILERLCRDKHILEIGTGLGISTRHISRTALSLVTVDPDPWVEDPCLPNTVFRRVRPEGIFDLVFIDGHHVYADVLEDIRLSKEIPEIVIHDTDIQDVQRAIQDAKLKTIRIYDTSCRLGLFTPT